MFSCWEVRGECGDDDDDDDDDNDVPTQLLSRDRFLPWDSRLTASAALVRLLRGETEKGAVPGSCDEGND